MKQKLLALALGLILLLSGCGFNIQPEGAAFAEGLLRNRYYGEVSADYLRLAVTSPEHAAEDYQKSLAAEMAYFCDYLGISEENSDAEQLCAFVTAAYSRISFVVGEQQVSEGVITVPVTVQPLRLFDHITREEYVPVVAPLWEKYSISADEGLSGMSAFQRNRYEGEFFSAILTLLESHLESAAYGEGQVVQLRLEREGDYYRPNTEDLTTIHALVLGYE